jgi:hypothetical protein
MISPKLIYGAALLGLIASLAIHVCALLGLVWMPGWWMWILHIGVFLTAIPAFRFAELDDKSVSITEHYRRIRRVFSACPPAMSYGTVLIFLYGIGTVIAGTDFSFGRAADMPGTINRVRSFSAVWSAFFAVTGTVSYSVMRRGGRVGHRATDDGGDDGPGGANQE